MDIVRIFEQYCNDENIEFHYGSENHLNLIEGTLDESKIYLLLFPPKRNAVKSSLNLSVNKISYTGKFMLLVASDYAGHYFKENNSDPLNSKFTKNVEPLIEKWKSAYKSLACLDVDFEQWSCIDAVNVLDANKDGLWCDFNIIIND